MSHLPVNGPKPYAWDVLIQLDAGNRRVGGSRRVVTVIAGNRGDAARIALEQPLAIQVVKIVAMTETQYLQTYGARRPDR